MASASIIQIAAVGPQNAIIYSSPERTLWKAAHVRYTNFSQDIQEVELTQGVAFDGKASANLVRYGDLVKGIIIEYTLPALLPAALVDGVGDPHPVIEAYWVNGIGFALTKEAEAEIGATTIQKLTSENMWTYEELFNDAGRRLRDMIGRFDYSDTVEDEMIEWSSKQQKIYVPIPFYISAYGESSLAWPMVALTRHDIKIKLSFNSLADCVCSVYKPTAAATASDPYLFDPTLPLSAETNVSLTKNDLTARLLVSYVYISDEERDAFTDNELQYLIVQDQNHVESVSASQSQATFQLHFSHPVSWVDVVCRPVNWNTSAGRRRYSVGFKDRFDYSMKVVDASLPLYGDAEHFFTEMDLKFNSHSRLPSGVAPRFYQQYQPYEHARSIFTGFQYLWAFALKIFDFNPTSTANMSKIDNVTAYFKFATGIPASEILYHANSYNQILIKRGMLGLRFSS